MGSATRAVFGICAPRVGIREMPRPRRVPNAQERSPKGGSAVCCADDGLDRPALPVSAPVCCRKEALLYTEMVTAPALVRGQALHLLGFSPAEHPMALQLGGSDPEELAKAAKLGAAEWYDEINLNVGCPSDRVQSGTFGAVLMQEPGLVAECCAAMIEAVDVEVTVKCRIGVDDQDPQTVLPEFLSRISAAGVRAVRHPCAQGLASGAQPQGKPRGPAAGLRSGSGDEGPVSRAASEHQRRHHRSLDQAEAFLDAGMDGVMFGRAAYHNPADVLCAVLTVVFSGRMRLTQRPRPPCRRCCPISRRI